jgi:hypothetical protein
MASRRPGPDARSRPPRLDAGARRAADAGRPRDGSAAADSPAAASIGLTPASASWAAARRPPLQTSAEPRPRSRRRQQGDVRGRLGLPAGGAHQRRIERHDRPRGDEVGGAAWRRLRTAPGRRRRRRLPKRRGDLPGSASSAVTPSRNMSTERHEEQKLRTGSGTAAGTTGPSAPTGSCPRRARPS